MRLNIHSHSGRYHPVLQALILSLALFASRQLGAQEVGWTADAAAEGVVDQLYLVAEEAHDSQRDHFEDVRAKALTDSVYAVHADGAYIYDKVTYHSSVDGLEIPAYVFAPTNIEGDEVPSLPALVWVHGGVHGDWNESYLPFVKEAVRRGYVVIAPDYRGSTGYGLEFHNAIDYGGFEIDDVLSAADYLVANVPQVDPNRIAVMGWSHGGFIAAHAVFRSSHPFRTAVSVVPVSNLIFRLSYKGEGYQSLFASQPRIGGLPHERREVYEKRSPLFHIDSLQVPMLVQVATNDEDVMFFESQMFVNALNTKKSDLAQTEIYTNPSGGHEFTRLVDENYQALSTPAMRTAWNRTWSFLERNLRAIEGD